MPTLKVSHDSLYGYSSYIIRIRVNGAEDIVRKIESRLSKQDFVAVKSVKTVDNARF